MFVIIRCLRHHCTIVDTRLNRYARIARDLVLQDHRERILMPVIHPCSEHSPCTKPLYTVYSPPEPISYRSLTGLERCGNFAAKSTQKWRGYAGGIGTPWMSISYLATLLLDSNPSPQTVCASLPASVLSLATSLPSEARDCRGR